jgi:hypothetical protein
MNNHSRISKTIAKDVKLNLGGGAEATVNLHLNEEGFLLIEGLGIPAFNYEWHWHKDEKDNDLVELQILCPEEDE